MTQITATLQPAHKTAYSFPTTAAQVGKGIYVLNSRLDTLLTKDATKVIEYLSQKYGAWGQPLLAGPCSLALAH